MVPDSEEMCECIAIHAKRVSAVRFLWKEILDESFDWNYEINPICIKRFFKRNDLSHIYNRCINNDFNFLFIAYQDLSYWTSVELLRIRFDQHPEIHDAIARIVIRNKLEIGQAMNFCKSAIFTEMLAKDIYTNELSEELEEIFKKLLKDIFLATSAPSSV